MTPATSRVTHEPRKSSRRPAGDVTARGALRRSGLLNGQYFDVAAAHTSARSPTDFWAGLADRENYVTYWCSPPSCSVSSGSSSSESTPTP